MLVFVLCYSSDAIKFSIESTLDILNSDISKYFCVSKNIV